MNPTLEDVALLAGVSRSTVSRVINHHPYVRPETREMVWKAVQDSGYQPHAAARSLVTNRTQIISVIIPEAVTTLFADPFFPLLLRGATDACNTHQYQLLLSLFTVPAQRQEMLRRALYSGLVDGVIVASAPMDDPMIPDLLEDDIPLVSVGRHMDERVNYVDVDNVRGAREATEHLIRLGHRRIATITGPADSLAARDRLEGYRQALEARRIPVDDDLIVEGDFGEASGQAGAQQLLSRSPTAIFAASDMMAIGAIRAARDVGVRIPQDVALVGFDDVPLASVIEPSITTVRQPIERMGSMAVEMLLGILGNGQDAESPTHRVVLPTELMVRASCGSSW